MNFTDIVASVVEKHKRPDKLIATRNAVNSAVLFYSTEFDYDRDLVEAAVVIAPASYTHEIALSTLPRFRKIDYMRYAGTIEYIEKLASRKLTSNCDVRDKWYIAGDALRINMRRPASGLDLSYYRYPPTLTDLSPDYWMLDGNWRAIQEHAAATIFNDIGDAQSSAKAMQDSIIAATIFRGDYVRADQHS